jgi:flagellar biosynthetic protein FliR
MTTWALCFALVLARVGTFIGVLPLLGGSSLPRLVKTGLALVLTVFWFTSIYPSLPEEELFARTEAPWLFVGMTLGKEMLLGLLLGFAFGLFLVPAHVAGEYVTQEMGLSFGNLINAVGGSATGSLTAVFETIAALIFFGLDGHHLFLAVFHSTFTKYPIGGSLPHMPVAQLVDGAAAAQEWGLLLVAPVGVCLFLMTVVLALMTRAAPQLNLFSVGFPLRLLTGLAALFVLAPDWITALAGVLGRFGELILGLV